MTEQEINRLVSIQRRYFRTGATLSIEGRVEALGGV